MNLDIAFPSISFSSTELHEIGKALNTPAVRKYLIQQQKEILKDLGNGLPRDGESAESYLRRHCGVVGGLEVIERLLGITLPEPSQK